MAENVYRHSACASVPADTVCLCIYGIVCVYTESEPDDKPGYVVNGHLSDPAVAGRLKRPT